MLANAGCLDLTMDNLAKVGVASIAVMDCMADSRKKLQTFVEKACHLGYSLADMAEAAKVISVYVDSESTTLVVAKTIAESAVQDLPLPAIPMDRLAHKDFRQA